MKLCVILKNWCPVKTENNLYCLINKRFTKISPRRGLIVHLSDNSIKIWQLYEKLDLLCVDTPKYQ